MNAAFRFDVLTPTPDDRPLFVAGNFNDWNPADERFQLQRTGDEQFTLELPAGAPLPDVLEYKYTRGGWDHVELSAIGEGLPNRFIETEEGFRFDVVPHWRWFGQPFNPDFQPHYVELPEEFTVPPLAQPRRVAVMLPHDYDAHPEKRYPVLYLNDGQNLCGEGAGYGCWQVEHKMAVLAGRKHHEVILVLIDHGNEERIREYTFGNTRAGKGRGRHYLRFVAETLKPYIDANLRTLPDAAHTGIGGSSLGGLISIYAGLMFPNVFGRLMVFSPSLWISPKIYFDAIKFQTPAPMKVYIYGGEAESKYMVPNIERFNEALLRQQYGGMSIDLHISIDPQGLHQESHWGREFPKAVEWLFY